ncbi:hypothetical protein [Streptomyces tendae]|uniref:hypothetical protein n=1 Tax=Streptomyces tendae TaxID=1932 RepID=UPI003EB7473C
MTGPRVWLDSGDGWQEIHGIRSISLDYQPPDPIEGYGTGEIRGVLAACAGPLPTPEEKALEILRPHLVCCPLYRDA